MNNCGESGRERKIKDLAINNIDGNCVCVCVCVCGPGEVMAAWLGYV